MAFLQPPPSILRPTGESTVWYGLIYETLFLLCTFELVSPLSHKNSAAIHSLVADHCLSPVVS